MKYLFYILWILVYLIELGNVSAQLDYNQMDNWAFHPNKFGSLLDGYNLNIGVVDHQLNTIETIPIANRAMENTGIDVFFVHPTLLTTLPGDVQRINIPLADQPEWLINTSIIGQAGLLAKYGRFFAPRYRQATPATFIGSPTDSLQAVVISLAYHDIKAAFLHYLEHHNQGNRIILAGHSQGAFLLSMLLADLFDDDESLRNRLVTAVVAGVVSAYAAPGEFAGGWWQNIPLCTTIRQCACAMTWRSFKEGQSIPIPGFSLPSLNPFLVDAGLVHRPFNLSNDWVLQDSLFYSTQTQPLRNYLFPKTNQSYGGNVGFIAFDSLYQIRYLREAPRRAGLMVQHTPKPNDLRPNILLDEESNVLFALLGYHNRDYSIYNWALLEQIDQKIGQCGVTTNMLTTNIPSKGIELFPNPSEGELNIRSVETVIQINIYSLSGQLIKTKNVDSKSLQISIHDLLQGIYFIQLVFEQEVPQTFRLIRK